MSEPVERVVDELGYARDVRFFRAPGRVNLMGDHTDYNEDVQATYDARGRQTPRHRVLLVGYRQFKRRPERTEERGG